MGTTLSKFKQGLVVTIVVGTITGISLMFRESLGYREIAFVLLLAVSVMALFLDIWPVVGAALGSAVLWDYLFIPPRFTLTVGTREDQFLLITYFIVAVLHAVLTSRIRKAQREISKREQKANAATYYNTVLNSLSHELRTPITTIVGSSDSLLNNVDKLSVEERNILLTNVNSAALRLNYQVENLLNMSRLESGVFEVRKDWVDLRELIYDILKRNEENIINHQVSVFVSEDLPLFKLDYGLMDLILSNLLTNAFQHTPPGTAIVITAATSDDTLRLVVADNGKGFPERDVERAFEKFYRVNGSRPGGTGLGLSIVKGFVEAQGGAITLRNLPLSGAELSMEFKTDISYLNSLKNE